MPRLASLSLGAPSGGGGQQDRRVFSSESSPPRYGLSLPRLLDHEVARLHGFDSPTAVVAFARWCKSVESRVSQDELPQEEDC